MNSLYYIALIHCINLLWGKIPYHINFVTPQVQIQHSFIRIFNGLKPAANQ